MPFKTCHFIAFYHKTSHFFVVFQGFSDHTHQVQIISNNVPHYPTRAKNAATSTRPWRRRSSLTGLAACSPCSSSAVSAWGEEQHRNHTHKAIQPENRTTPSESTENPYKSTISHPNSEPNPIVEGFQTNHPYRSCAILLSVTTTRTL